MLRRKASWESSRREWARLPPRSWPASSWFAAAIRFRWARSRRLGTIRLGKRTDGRSPKIKDFVQLASLEDIVFGGWDIFPDNAYQAAAKAGVLDREDLDKVEEVPHSIKPMKAVFDQNYVKKLDGPHVKKGKNKYDLAQQLKEDIRDFKKKNKLDRVSWSGAARRKFS